MKQTLRAKVTELLAQNKTTGEIFKECKELGLTTSYASTAIEIHKQKKNHANNINQPK